MQDPGIDTGLSATGKNLNVVGTDIEVIARWDLHMAQPTLHTVHVAHELDHERGCGMIENLLRRADLFDGGGIHDDDFVGELEGFLLVVSDKDGRELDIFMKLTKPAAQVFAHLRVQRTERFIQEKDARSNGEGSGEGDALALSAGEFVRESAAIPSQLHQAEQFLDPLANRRASGTFASFANGEAEGDVLAYGHMPEEGVMLKDHADLPLPGGGGTDIFTMKP